MSSFDDVFMASSVEEEEDNDEMNISIPDFSSEEETMPSPQQKQAPSDSNQKQFQSDIKQSTSDTKRKQSPLESKPKHFLSDSKPNRSPSDSKQKRSTPEIAQKLSTSDSKNSTVNKNTPPNKIDKTMEKSSSNMFHLGATSSNSMDIPSQIEEMKFLINSRNKKFEAEFEDLKRKHQEKLTILKQTHITREQSISSSYDLEYRNAVWTTTLQHLNRGCFTEDLGPLFQQTISDEQYKLEKEIIDLKKKNEEEINQIKMTLPKEQPRKQPMKRRINLDIMNPIEMAHIIYNKVLSENEIDGIDPNDGKNLNRILKKLHRETNKLASIHFDPPQPTHRKQKRPKLQEIGNKQVPIINSKRKKSPILRENDRYISFIESHQKACNHLQKSVKDTDKFLKNLKDNDWFNDMFPHVE
ncbi:hypothetical protein TRFO_15407 [Tritrichomonas foetus]|uniref:Uncharacterized protein n=1 Tax=Tritrichomonas foetus TaxID=1144522 RepID=A0A1J4KSL2_9EUKA|nr:hypothetical protein TRFO_15407 [Tritrichomonas foetus]|eukprot:OHT14251.1 hypothetical protein TRFO_15407 [Tritrichomonas foetus]